MPGQPGANGLKADRAKLEINQKKADVDGTSQCKEQEPLIERDDANSECLIASNSASEMEFYLE